MKTLCLSLLAVACLAPAQSDDTYSFKRGYKAGDVLKYRQEMDFKGSNSAPITADLDVTVKSVVPDGALLDLKVTVNIAAAGGPQSIASKVGVTGFPDAGGLNDAGQPFIFMGVAGATTGGKVKVGDGLKVHWQNDKKDTTIDETGKILSVDKTAKTMTVEWKAKMSVTYATGATFKFKSVYSTDDFSLVSSEGVMTTQGTDMTLKFTRRKE